MKQSQVVCRNCDYLLERDGRNFCTLNPPVPTLINADANGNVSILNMRPEILDLDSEFCGRGAHTPSVPVEKSTPPKSNLVPTEFLTEQERVAGSNESEN